MVYFVMYFGFLLGTFRAATKSSIKFHKRKFKLFHRPPQTKGPSGSGSSWYIKNPPRIFSSGRIVTQKKLAVKSLRSTATRPALGDVADIGLFNKYFANVFNCGRIFNRREWLSPTGSIWITSDTTHLWKILH